MRADTRRFTLPLADPLETARGRIERRDGVLLRIEADDGAVGVGEATPLAGWTEPREDCERALERAVEAVESGADLDGLLADSDATDGPALSETPAARHALEVAVEDLRASRDGRPLYRRLGATARFGAPGRVESVPVNATVGDAPVEETVVAAEQAVATSFDCLKLKVGVRPVSADVERVERVRDALDAKAGETDDARTDDSRTDDSRADDANVELRADANGAWSRVQAQQFLDAVGEKLAYVEQPLPATDLAGLAALSGPVALDETLTAVEFDDALDANPEAVVLKPMALGGPRRTVEVAERAREKGIVPVVTTTIDGAVARTAAVHAAAAIPDPPACGLATAGLLESDLGPDVAPVTDGRAVVPQGDGNGTADAWGNRD